MCIRDRFGTSLIETDAGVVTAAGVVALRPRHGSENSAPNSVLPVRAQLLADECPSQLDVSVNPTLASVDDEFFVDVAVANSGTSPSSNTRAVVEFANGVLLAQLPAECTQINNQSASCEIGGVDSDSVSALRIRGQRLDEGPVSATVVVTASNQVVDVVNEVSFDSGLSLIHI